MEQIWKELRKCGFRNERFPMLDKVIDRLCETICSLAKETIISITCRQWIYKCFSITCGGALELKKIADIADENGAAVAVHMAESPVGCMSAVHVATAMHNVLAVEFHSIDVPWWSDMVNGLPHPLIENGFIRVPQAPGLGIESLNEDVLRAHINPDIPGIWETTTAWNKEFSNDRLLS